MFLWVSTHGRFTWQPICIGRRNVFGMNVHISIYKDVTYFYTVRYMRMDLWATSNNWLPESNFISTYISWPNWWSFKEGPGQEYPKPACMRNLMTVEEEKGVCKDRSQWKEVISAYLNGKRAWCYVYISTTLYPRRGNKDISVIPPRHSNFTKITMRNTADVTGD
jgi:hypothetical protein